MDTDQAISFTSLRQVDDRLFNHSVHLSSPSFFLALPAKLESTLTFAESLGGTSTTHSPAATNLPARCLRRPRAFSIA